MAEIEKLINNLNEVQKAIRINNLKSEFDKSFTLEVINQAIQTIRELQNQIPKVHLCEDELPSFKNIADDEELLVMMDTKEVTTLCWTATPEWCFYDRTTNDVYSPYDEVIAWCELPKFEGVE